MKNDGWVCILILCEGSLHGRLIPHVTKVQMGLAPSEYKGATKLTSARSPHTVAKQHLDLHSQLRNIKAVRNRIHQFQHG